MQLHHYGFVLEDIESGISSFQKSLGAQWDGKIFEDPHQKVKVAFLVTRPEDAQLELVQPLGPDSPVYRFLKQQGGGLHHACWVVDDLDAHLLEMRSRGANIAKRPKPAVAFGGRRIAWVITREKLLVEFIEASLREPSSSEP